MQAGAAPDAVDEQGRTPARVAAACGHRDIVAALLRRAGGGGGGSGSGGGDGKSAGGGGSGGGAGVEQAADDLVAEVQRAAKEVG